MDLESNFAKYFGHIMYGLDFMAKSIFENLVKNEKDARMGFFQNQMQGAQIKIF